MRFYTFFVFFAVLFAFTNCKSKNEELTVQVGSNYENDTMLTSGKLAYNDYNAIVVGEGVRLRSKPNVGAEVIGKLNTGALLKIIRSSKTKTLLEDADKCNPDGFLWYEVLASEGERGWIYGEFLYKIISEGKNDDDCGVNIKKLNGQRCSFKKIRYRIGLAKSEPRAYTTPNDEDRCVNYTIPFMSNINDATVFPLRFFQNKNHRVKMVDLTKEQNYFRFTKGGIFDDELLGFNVEPDLIRLFMRRKQSYEGIPSFNYTLDIKFAEEGYFSIAPSEINKQSSLR